MITHSPQPASVAPKLREGRLQPMGAHLITHRGHAGVNFCVFSSDATAIEVCLYDASGKHEVARFALNGPHDQVFHGFLSREQFDGAVAGLVYGLRAHGPYAPHQGQRFNPNKLLLDPCAREIVGDFQWLDEHHGYPLGHPDGTNAFDARDNGAGALKARVALPAHTLPGPDPSANAPRRPTRELVLYEMHVLSFSATMPQIPAEQRGTYAALHHPAAIEHFKRLGVTTLSLLPVHHAIDEAGLAQRGAVNHWGYNTLGFFAPTPRYACQPRDPSAVVEEFRRMVHGLHEAGLEVVLDVVYNHTAEGDERGPTLSFRGLDNAGWYMLHSTDSSRSENLTGCGNTLNAGHPRVTQFVLDSLRHWVEVMGVDGFRFDLASVLGRTREGFDLHAPFFAAIRQDPLLSQVHLIAEPWDAAPGGYQVGRFPGRFLDWNDRFRDDVRAFWLGRQDVTRGHFARRLMASSDLFHHSQRRPSASVNFIAAHDGYTLRDLLSYSHKHNEANGESNLDGRSDELCRNHGVEGDTGDEAIVAQRKIVARSMLATLLLAQGTPMLAMGDELWRSQRGNNNAYCRAALDTIGELTAIHWNEADETLIDWVGQLTRLRHHEPALHHDDWYADDPQGHAQLEVDAADASAEAHADQGADRSADSAERFDHPGWPRVVWRAPSGQPMQPHDWHDTHDKAFACVLQSTPRHAPLVLIFNANARAQAITLPSGEWQLLLDAASPRAADTKPQSGVIHAPAHGVMALRRIKPTRSTPPPSAAAHAHHP